MKADERILPGIFADDVGCMVSGAVVLNDQFMDGVGLCQNRVQLLTEKLFSVIGNMTMDTVFMKRMFFCV